MPDLIDLNDEEEAALARAELRIEQEYRQRMASKEGVKPEPATESKPPSADLSLPLEVQPTAPLTRADLDSVLGELVRKLHPQQPVVNVTIAGRSVRKEVIRNDRGEITGVIEHDADTPAVSAEVVPPPAEKEPDAS